jgi:hypothetical protein
LATASREPYLASDCCKDVVDGPGTFVMTADGYHDLVRAIRL